MKFSKIGKRDVTFIREMRVVSYKWILFLLKVSRSEQNCRAITFPKKQTDNFFFYPDDLKILETWNGNSNFKDCRVFRIEEQIRPLVFWEKLRINNFVSRSTGLYLTVNFWIKFENYGHCGFWKGERPRSTFWQN